MLHYDWTEEDMEDFFQVIKDKNRTTISESKQTIKNVILLNLVGRHLQPMLFTPFNGNTCKCPNIKKKIYCFYFSKKKKPIETAIISYTLASSPTLLSS